MAAFLIADIEVTDSAGFEEYKRLANDTITAYGGKYVVRGGGFEVLEGDWSPRRIVILEFPNVSLLKAWYDSPEYAPLKHIRERSANSRFVMVEGL